MKIRKFMKRENSGLAYTTLEHAKFEAALGHSVCIREPNGRLLFGRDEEPDIETVHSQCDLASLHNGIGKVLITHGEPLSSVANGVSFKAVIDLATVVDAFIAMRKGELAVWNLIKRTHYVPKGIDLERFCPADGPVERLEGEPAVLVYENPRGSRNALYIITAMAQVVRRLPKARLHLYNMNDKKQADTFQTFIKHAKLWTYVRSLQGRVPFEQVPFLLNRVDIVCSALHPLSARGIEALGCGRAYISAGYEGEGYPWIPQEYSPEAFAETIVACWENYDKVHYREYAEQHHNEAESAKERCEIYARYVR